MRSAVGAFWNGSRLELRRWPGFFFLLLADDLCAEVDVDGAAAELVVCAGLAAHGFVAASTRPNSPRMTKLCIFELGSSLPAVRRTFAVRFPGRADQAPDSIMNIFGFGSSDDLEFGAYRAPGRKAARSRCRLRRSDRFSRVRCESRAVALQISRAPECRCAGGPTPLGLVSRRVACSTQTATERSA
jgi:hypothetical protein